MGMPEFGVSEFIAFVFVWFCHGIEQNDTPLPMQYCNGWILQRMFAMVGFGVWKQEVLATECG
jgi:hypothetical protein